MSLLALALGAAAGFTAAAWFGPRIRGALANSASPFAAQVRRPALHAARLVREVRDVLAADLLLAPLALEPILVSAGQVQLHGWVPTRALRARAWRVACRAPGLEDVINCILVRGEDDAAPGAATL